MCAVLALTHTMCALYVDILIVNIMKRVEPKKKGFSCIDFSKAVRSFKLIMALAFVCCIPQRSCHSLLVVQPFYLGNCNAVVQYDHHILLLGRHLGKHGVTKRD